MTSEPLPSRISRDALYDGAITLFQPAKGAGYRANVDALILADFASTRRASRACDLGAGVGAVALCMWANGSAKAIDLVENDEAHAALAERNIAANGAAHLHVVRRDVAAHARANRGVYDLVVANPPYFAPGTGRPSKDATRNARSGDLAPFVKAARALIGARGRFCIVYPAQSFASLVETLRASGLEPKRARFVHATNDAPARVVTVEAMPAKAGGLVVAAPLIERVGNGYSAEMNLLVRGERRAKSI